jgi:hypothetical protein
MSVGSLLGISDADAQTSWPFPWKNARKVERTSAADLKSSFGTPVSDMGRAI